MNSDKELQDAIYLYMLGQVKGVGPVALHQIVKAFPQHQALANASPEKVTQELDRHVSQVLIYNVLTRWAMLWEPARVTMQHHVDKKVFPIPITSERYPHLLKQIPDPPAILYLKGDVSILSQTDSVAIVGTREPTLKGREIAAIVAKHFAEMGFMIVSGLAKGIDTAAHVGAIEAGGKTIAVLGTPLNKIYPAENKQLARRICDEAGALVSELAFGQESFKVSFVRRDRIQSGLSLGVIPVQTKREGGTMHTVEFARKQKRLIFCPRPNESEAGAEEYEGIWHLIKECGIQDFQTDDYSILLALFKEYKQRLSLSSCQTTVKQPENNDKKLVQGELEF